jgi:hypothetical protein
MPLIPDSVVDSIVRVFLRRRRILISVIRVFSVDNERLNQLMSRNRTVADLGKNLAFVRKLLRNPDSFEYIVKFFASNTEALRRILIHPEIKKRIGGQAEFLDSLASSKAATRRIVSSEKFFTTLSEIGEEADTSPIGLLLKDPRAFEAMVDFITSNPEALHQALSQAHSKKALFAQGEFLDNLVRDPEFLDRLAQRGSIPAVEARPSALENSPLDAAALPAQR